MWSLAPAWTESKASTCRRNSRSPSQASSSKLARCFGSHSEVRWNSSSICAQRSGVKNHLPAMHLAVQPGLSHFQITAYRYGRNFERLRDLFHRQPAKISELHRLALPWIELFECRKAQIES